MRLSSTRRRPHFRVCSSNFLVLVRKDDKLRKQHGNLGPGFQLAQSLIHAKLKKRRDPGVQEEMHGWL